MSLSCREGSMLKDCLTSKAGGVFPSTSAILGSRTAAKYILGKQNTTVLQVLTETQTLLTQHSNCLCS